MDIVKIFTAPLQFPCGPGTTCCSVGQSAETVSLFISALTGLGLNIKVYNIEENGEELFTKYPDAGELLKEFGPGITPILIMNDEVLGVGVATPEIARTIISEKLAQS
jgi:hypothetical protein